jgi:hypothetical protein
MIGMMGYDFLQSRMGGMIIEYIYVVGLNPKGVTIFGAGECVQAPLAVAITVGDLILVPDLRLFSYTSICRLISGIALRNCSRICATRCSVAEGCSPAENAGQAA